MTAKRAVALALALAATNAGATDIDPYWLGEIPAEYRGRWNIAAGGCAPFTGRLRLEISAKRLAVGGDTFEPTYMRWHEDGGIGVVSRYVGPARSWERVDYFDLSADRQTLTGEHARRKIVRRRCRS